MTIHVFQCSHEASHVHEIDDDGSPEGAAFGVALRQTRARFLQGRCDAYVPGGIRGEPVPCSGSINETTKPSP